MKLSQKVLSLYAVLMFVAVSSFVALPSMKVFASTCLDRDRKPAPQGCANLMKPDFTVDSQGRCIDPKSKQPYGEGRSTCDPCYKETPVTAPYPKNPIPYSHGCDAARINSGYDCISRDGGKTCEIDKSSECQDVVPVDSCDSGPKNGGGSGSGGSNPPPGVGLGPRR